MKKLIVLLALLAGLSIRTEGAENLTVAAGETLDITETVTYNIVTVNGTLNLKGGTLTAAGLRISDGSDQKNGKVVVNGGTLSLGGDTTLYIGYNGGTGELEITTGNNNIINNLVLGHGNGSGNVYRINGGFHQGSSIRNVGVDSEVIFGGGYVKLNDAAFIPQSGNLTVKAVSGKLIQIRPFSNGDRYLIDPSEEHTGTIRTEGPGAFYIYCVKNGGKIRLKALPGNRMTWAHAGGVRIASGTTATVPFIAYENGNFFVQGGTPQDLYLAADSGKVSQVFDVNGQTVALRSVSSNSQYLESVVTNSAAKEGAIRFSLDDATQTVSLSGEKLTWDPAVRLVKDGACRLDLAYDGFVAPLTVKDGVLNISTNIAPSAIDQAGGLVKVAAHCKLTMADGASWSNPSMEEGSQGLVETKGNVTFGGDSIGIRGELNVASGALTCPGAAGSTWHRYFRFTMKYPTARSSNCIALSRLRLLDAEGNVLSDGLTKVAAGTPAAELPAGTCSFAETGYAESSESDITHLFDGLPTTQICLTKCSFPDGADMSKNTWRIINFRLPENEARSVSQYQLTTGTDINKVSQSRMVTNWTLESSADGVTWQEIDARSGYSWNTLPEPPGQDMPAGPYLARTAAPGPESVSVGTLSVASGASANFTGKDVSVAGLAVDMSAYAGGNATIAGFDPATCEKVSLTNVTGDAPYALPIDFEGMANAKLKGRTVVVENVTHDDWIYRAVNGLLSVGPVPGLLLLFR